LAVQTISAYGRGQGVSPPSFSAELSPVTINLTAIGDAYVLDAQPNRNFGSSTELVVGRDPANGSTYRALVQFDLSSVPPYAKVANATLKIHAANATSPGTVDVYRVRAPWTEGTGVEAYARNITVTETASLARIREPVVVHLGVGGGMSGDPKADFLLYDSIGREVPSQVSNVTLLDGKIVGLDLAFESTHAPGESKRYTVRYGLFPGVPGYRTKSLSSVPLWTYAASSVASPVVVDLNGDGLLEVVIGTTDGKVTALRWDGATLSTLWTYVAPGAVVLPLRVADLTGDGSPEILFENTDSSPPFNNTLTALSASGRYLWHFRLPTAPTGPFAAADTDGDGIVEVFTGDSSGNSSFYAIRGSDGAMLCQYQDLGSTAFGFGFAVGDVTGTSAPEVVFTDSQGKVRMRNPDCSNALPPGNTKPGASSISVAPSLANLSFDSRGEILAGDRNGVNSREYLVSGLNWSTLASSPTLGSDVTGGQLVVDADRDGSPEVYVVTQDGVLHRLTRGLAQTWTFAGAANGTSVGSPVAADVDLDGKPDVLYGTRGSVVYAVSANGTAAWRWVVGAPVVDTPVVADLDGDGTMEVLVASDNSTDASRAARLYAFGTGSLGHDTRTVGYNTLDTGLWFDGNSPDGKALLQWTLGPVGGFTAGVTWTTRDGTVPWANPGIDIDATPLASAVTAAGTWATWNVTGLAQAWVNGSSPNTGLALKSDDESSLWNVSFASREYGGGLSPTLELTYTADPSPQIRGTVPDQVRLEDSPAWTLNLLPYAWDPDTPVTRLRWDLVGINSSLVQVLGGNVTGNHALTFQPMPDANGVGQGTLFLFDDEGNVDSQPIRVELVPVNDAPKFDPPGVFYVRHDTPYTFDFEPYMSDIDDPIASLALSANDTDHATVSGLQVTFFFPQAFDGLWAYVVLTVTDSSGATASQVIAIKVTSDYPPKLDRPLPDVLLFEGQWQIVFDLDDYFTDPDTDSLFFTYGYTHLTLTIYADHSVNISAPGEWTGQENVTFRAEDPTGAIAEDTILVTVIPIDDPPSIAPLLPFAVHYDYPFDFDLTPYLSDPDTPLEALAVDTSNPANVTVTGHVLTLLYPAQLGSLTAPYTVPLTITVRDARTAVSTNTSVAVSDNFPPRLSKTLPDERFPEDTTRAGVFDLDAYFVDIDGPILGYAVQSTDVRVTINADHTVDLGARENWSGREVVTFRAIDERGAFAEDSINVFVTPVNDAPVIFPLPKQTLFGFGTWILDLTPFVTDSDSPRSDLVLSVVGNPRVRPAGLFLVFDYSQASLHEWVTVAVSDGQLSAQAVIEVEVIGPNPLLPFLPAVVAALIGVCLVVVSRLLRTRIEEVFLVHNSGVLVAHLSRTLTPDRDADVLSGMFTVVQLFAKQSMGPVTGGEMKGMSFGDHRLTVARGTNVYLAVLFRSAHPLAERRVRRRAEAVLQDLEARFGEPLKDWSGFVDEVGEIRTYLEKFFEAKTKIGPRETGQSRGENAETETGSAEIREEAR